jgi:hypothetical protein
MALIPFCQQRLLEVSDKRPESAAYPDANRGPRHGLLAIIRDVADGRRVVFLDVPERDRLVMIKRQKRSSDAGHTGLKKSSCLSPQFGSTSGTGNCVDTVSFRSA